MSWLHVRLSLMLPSPTCCFSQALLFQVHGMEPASEILMDFTIRCFISFHYFPLKTHQIAYPILHSCNYLTNFASYFSIT